MLAGLGCGAFSTLEQARAGMVRTLPAEEPDAGSARVYEEAFARDVEVERRLVGEQ